MLEGSTAGTTQDLIDHRCGLSDCIADLEAGQDTAVPMKQHTTEDITISTEFTEVTTLKLPETGDSTSGGER